MKASELRIGNYVLYASEGIVFKVTETCINGLRVSGSHEDIWIEIDQFEGVPLYEEWLFKFGFEAGIGKKYNTLSIKVAGSLFSINANNGLFWTPCNEYGKVTFAILGIPVLMEYVHQLQNLYFALTGEELTIK